MIRETLKAIEIAIDTINACNENETFELRIDLDYHVLGVLYTIVDTWNPTKYNG